MMKLYPNQFLLTPTRADFLENTNSIQWNQYNFFYLNSDAEKLIYSDQFLFFGEIFHHQFPKNNNRETFNHIDFNAELPSIFEKISEFSGYFFLLFQKENNLYFLNDAGSQLETYYIFSEKGLQIAQQPQILFPLLNEEEKATDAPDFFKSNRKSIFEKTIFHSVFKLIPNHFVDIKNQKQQRFYPTQKLKIEDIEVAANKAVNILQNTMLALKNRKPIALPLTAGWDSRVLFAASLNFLSEIDVFLANHQYDYTQTDIQIASQITQDFGKKLQLISYNLDEIEVKDEFQKAVFHQDLKTHQLSVVCNQQYFPHHYIVNGNVSEVARNFYQPLPKRISAKDMAYISGFPEDSYAVKYFGKWKKNFSAVKKLGYDELDFLYWEHKMPNWAGTAKSISNLYSTSISPFNNRLLLSVLLSVNTKFREKSHNQLYRKIIEKMSVKLATYPINPTKKKKKIEWIKKLNLYSFYRTIFFRVRKLKF